MAVLLSGANDDGTAGFADVRSNGGLLIAQDPTGTSSPVMPQSVIEKGLADKVLEP